MSKLARRIGGPLIRYFDHRFDEIKQQLAQFGLALRD